MKIMLSVLNVERPLQTMQMAFGYVPMSVTIGLTPKCTTASSTNTVPDHYFVGAAFSNDYCSFLSDQFMQLN